MSRRPLRLRPLRDWTLRTRLITSFLAILLVVCTGIGLFAGVTVRNSLTDRLDNQLRAAAQISGHFGGPPRGRENDTRSLLPPGVPVGTVGASILDGQVLQSAFQDNEDVTPALSSSVQQVLAAVPPDGKPRTESLPGLGQYRVLATTLDSGAVEVTGFPTKSVTDTIGSLTLAITGLSLLALVLAAVLGTLFIRWAFRPLRRITATASRVAEMNLDEGEVAMALRVPDTNPHTEVGQVGVALNRMLDNVTDALNARHRSEMRVRQFVADASHELRTPLASIRGYAELTRRSRDIAPPDIAHAMSRVESEAARMTNLVEDLLLLARLDAGRPLDQTEVDLTSLAVDTLSDAHAAGPEHQWALDVPDEPVVVQGDGPRLHQVLANLLANARTHTPAGTTVDLRLKRTPTSAVISVHDNGPGIPAALMPDIFQRFSRGEQSRSRTAGSTGLGLAIVAAVVAAHGGRIDASSRPGDTTFTVTLPVHGNRQDSSQSAASLVSDAL